jgi:hypothetical protein
MEVSECHPMPLTHSRLCGSGALHNDQVQRLLVGGHRSTARRTYYAPVLLCRSPAGDTKVWSHVIVDRESIIAEYAFLLCADRPVG